MALPQEGANGVFVQTYPIADLGLAATVTSVLDVDSTVWHTLCPATVHVISKLTSGSGTLKLDRAAASASVAYGSADKSLSVSGTAEQCFTLDTTSSELYVGLQQTSASTAVWAQLAVLTMYRLPDTQLVSAIRQKAINMCSALSNDNAGSAVVILSIA